jgi:hypothetical protein
MSPQFRVDESAKRETGMKQVASRALFAACFMVVSCFDPEDGVDMFFQNFD